MNADKESIRRILTQSIVALCNTGLCFDAELSVEGLLGITLDKKDVFLVNIHEVVSTGGSPEKSDTETPGTDGTTQTVRKAAKRKHIEDHDTAVDHQRETREGARPSAAVKTETCVESLRTTSSQPGSSRSQRARQTEIFPSSDSDDDVVIVKEEYDTSSLPPTVQQYSHFLTSPNMSHPTPEAGSHVNATATLGAANISPDWMSNLITGFDDPGHGNTSRSSGQNDNTYQVTLRHVRLVRRWLVEVKAEQRELEDIPVDELDSYLADMWQNMKRQDGQEYGLGSLGQIRGRLDYYLKEKTGGTVTLQDAAFNKSNQVLAAKRVYLKNKAHMDRVKMLEEENNLWEKGHLGTADPETLLHTVYYFCSKSAKQNCGPVQSWQFDDVRIQTDSCTGHQFVELKHVTGPDRCIPSNGIEGRDPVVCFKEYIGHRPTGAFAPNSPFFLTPLTTSTSEDRVWYSDLAVADTSLESWKLATLASATPKK